jgi:hypothetical protein
VAKLADRLPVMIEGGKVQSRDGFSWSFTDRAMGLLYYNPLAPKRLIYWVAAETPKFYKAGAPLMEQQEWGFAGPDFLITHALNHQMVAARRFDSRWSWEPGYGDSPLLPDEVCSIQGSAEAGVRILRRAAGAEFALMGADWASTRSEYAKGETRWMDLLAREYDGRLAVMDLTGAELLAAEESLEKEKQAGQEWSIRTLPAPSSRSVEADRLYRVALAPWWMWDYAKATRTNPISYRLTDIQAKEALERHGAEATRKRARR